MSLTRVPAFENDPEAPAPPWAISSCAITHVVMVDRFIQSLCEVAELSKAEEVGLDWDDANTPGHCAAWIGMKGMEESAKGG